MLIAGFPAGSFAANCYVVAPGPGEECVIIDPGQDAEAGHRGDPRASTGSSRWRSLLTHGHIDHIWSVAPVCGARDIPAYIHPSDRALLSDPARGLGLPAGQQLFGGLTFTEPDDVAELADGMTVRLAGVELVVDHAPGHTPGSVTFRAAPGVMFSGDLLFAGLDRPDRPARRRLPDHPGQPGAGVPDPAGRRPGAARARARHDHRRRTGQQPVPGRPGPRPPFHRAPRRRTPAPGRTGHPAPPGAGAGRDCDRRG